MSTTSHKSRTRVLSEAAMKTRVHTSRENRNLTGDGVAKVHNEGLALKVAAKTTKAKSTATAAVTKKTPTNRTRG